MSMATKERPVPAGDKSVRQRGRIRSRVRGRGEPLLAAPLYLLLAVLVFVPLAMLVFGSVQTGSPDAPDSSFTLANLRALLEPQYLQVLGNTLLMAAVVTLFSVALGVVLAWLVARTDVPGKRLLEILVPLPLFLPPFAGAIAWIVLGSARSGLLNALYSSLFGTQSGFMNIMTFPGLCFVMTLFFTPYAYLFTIAPLKNMDGTLEEASRVLGASPRGTLLRVTFPMIMPGLLSAVLMVFVLSAELFSIPALIGPAAHYETLPYFIFRQARFSPPNWGLASAAGLALLLLMFVGMILQVLATRMSRRYVTISGKGRSPSVLRLGRWRHVLAAIPAVYILLSVVLPGAALLAGSFFQYFSSNFFKNVPTLRHWTTVLGTDEFWTSLNNTVLLSVIGPTIAVAFTLLLTYVWYRTRMPFRRAGEMAAMLPIAIPGVVFGVGVLWAFVWSPLYGTIGLLLVAYIARYLPYPVRSLSSTVVQIDSGLEEASRVAGAGPLRTIRSISFPLLKPAVLSSWLMLFIVIARELNVAIVIATGDSTTFPMVMWGEAQGGSLQGAAIIGLLDSALVLLAFIVARILLKIDLAKDQE